MIIRSLHVYPVKAARGITLEKTDVLRTGLAHDRRFMVVDDAGAFVTQRRHPEMALVRTSISADGHSLQLSVAGDRVVTIPLHPETAREPKRVRVTVWKDEVDAIDVGGEGAELFSDHLKMRCSFVYMPPETIRSVEQPYGRPGDHVGFADGYPVLVASLSSLAHLNERLVENGSAPVPIDRFRANIVIDGDPADPYGEERAGAIAIARAGTSFEDGTSLVLRMPKRCSRCQVVTVDQRTAEVSKEPLRTLGAYRTEANYVYFAMNAIPDLRDAPAEIAAGDHVRFTNAS